MCVPYIVERMNAHNIAFPQASSSEAGYELTDEDICLTGGDGAGWVCAIDVDLVWKSLERLQIFSLVCFGAYWLILIECMAIVVAPGDDVLGRDLKMLCCEHRHIFAQLRKWEFQEIYARG